MSLVVACDDSTHNAGQLVDASADSGRDAGSDGSALGDATTPDAAIIDAASDASQPDASQFDAAIPDAAILDASTVEDASVRDAQSNGGNDATTSLDSSVGPDATAGNNDAAAPESDAASTDAGPGVTVACAGIIQGVERDCGWFFSRDIICTPGAPITVGCSAAAGCAVGWCSGDTVLRLCAGNHSFCTSAEALGQNDDSCETSCSLATVNCPEQGAVTVLTGAYNSVSSYTCTIAVSP